ncbi:hypothetical protein [Halopseudomonas pelagia]|uniref:hypothetical protein n=1 Tax=Halopseudomonas pelagia TaxID=553151 RepID=UPI0030DB0027|tara:strand:- start:21805 stop:23076 length:1272 start_codon:yes stop_codon:yes gene_type:complete
MDNKPAVAPTEDHIKEMLGYWQASERMSLSMEQALQWCGIHHPELCPKRFGALLVSAAANRKYNRKPASDLVWQLTKDRFIPYDPAIDPAPGTREAAAWVIRLALQERPDVVRREILDQYCAILAAAIDNQPRLMATTQEIADGLADKLRKGEIEGFLSQISELSAAEYFRATHPAEFANHVPNPGSSSTGPDKNFDFTFQAEGVRFNVEVKAFSKAFDPNDKGGTKYFLPEPIKQSLYKAGAKMSPTLAPTTGRFLQDANDQLPRRSDDMNVVLLCCNDPDEYADVMDSLFGPYGLLGAYGVVGGNATQPNSIIPNFSLMTNIDAVVVCLTGFLHSGIVNTLRFSRAYKLDGCSLSDPELAWDFRYTFPCGFWLHRPPAERWREIALHKVFNSHLGLLIDYHKRHDGDWQSAVFALINHKSS